MNLEVWNDLPEIQERLKKIIAEQQRLQHLLGVSPRTLEERYQDYLQRKEEEKRKEEELAKYKQLVSQRAPLKFPRR